jgi:HD-like signal output (HDOD) protein
MSGSDQKIQLNKMLSGAQLPALPQSAIRLLELSQNPDNGPAQFSVPIESDPGLTSQVLRFVNSSYFGFRQEISSVKLAISLVGIRTIKNFALWSAVFSLMPNPKCGPFDLKSLWQDSLRRGILSRRLGKILGLPEAEDLFACSLLQDMAVPLLAKELPNQYHKLLEARKGGAHRLSNLEREEFGWTHGEAGATIAKAWHLPESFSAMIARHADADLTAADRTAGMNVIAVSALLPSTCDAEWLERDAFLPAFERLTVKHAISARDVFLDVEREFHEFAPVLRLAQPARPLVDYLEREPMVV